MRNQLEPSENEDWKILPEGNIFGDIDDDEFMADINGEPKGVFKRFQYLSTPFSITGDDEMMDELLESAERNATDFSHEISENGEASQHIVDVHARMMDNPAFSKELMDTLLRDVYVDDNIIAGIDAGDSLEANLGKVVAGWKHLSDFYSIEGLVGGDAEGINPFLEDEGSMVAGGLDSLETKLPAMREELSEDEWQETLLKVSSLVGRDYEQIDHGVDVLEHIHGVMDYDTDDIQIAVDTLDELNRERFDTNSEFGKFYNTFIRFHNWMPLKVTEDGAEGDAYDSICAPTDEALEMVDGELYESLSEIGDATSPKGLALAWIVDDQIEVDGETLGDPAVLADKSKEFERKIDQALDDRRGDFEKMDYDDPSMYPGMVGGKWKGLKLLDDAKEAFDLDYMMPDAEVVTSIGIENLFEEQGIDQLIYEDVFSMDEDRRQDIIDEIDSLDFEELTDGHEDNMIARSSMYGEDGASNFAGTYESFATSEELDADEAVREVVKSYFSEKAVNAREDKGMTHSGGISVIMQDMVPSDRGGVIHLTDEGYSISEAGDPEKAVEGEGGRKESDSLSEVLEGTAAESLEQDLERLQSVFGDIDLEYVHDGDDIYLTQMRPKHRVVEDSRELEEAQRYEIESFEEMYETDLNDGKYIVRLDFLGRENIMDREKEIEDFIRENRESISAVEGHMPPPAHIPNNIEGHFRIPYTQVEGEI